MRDILTISLGAIAGANARFFLSRYAAKLMGPVFPYGTLLINVSGSVVVGFFMIWATERVLIDPRWRLLRGSRLLRFLHHFLRLCLRDHGLLRARTMAADVQ